MLTLGNSPSTSSQASQKRKWRKIRRKNDEPRINHYTYTIHSLSFVFSFYSEWSGGKNCEPWKCLVGLTIIHLESIYISNFPQKMVSMNCAWFVLNCVSPLPKIGIVKKLWPLHFEFSPQKWCRLIVFDLHKIMFPISHFVLHLFPRYWKSYVLHIDVTSVWWCEMMSTTLLGMGKGWSTKRKTGSTIHRHHFSFLFLAGGGNFK